MHDIISTIEAGREQVGVKLGNSADRAWLYREDYDAITEEYGCVAWFLNGNGKGNFYVRFEDRKIKNLRSLARLIMGNPRGAAIRHADLNPLNLRSDNLIVQSGNGGIARKTKGKARKRALPTNTMSATLR